MKFKSSFAFIAATLCACLLFSKEPDARNLELINRFDQLVQIRFRDPMPQTLGMSRTASANSFGRNYQPILTDLRDFKPENQTESSLLAEMDHRQMQLGLYVFGLEVVSSEPAALNFRALKGPAAITVGTPRPLWYPASIEDSGHLVAPPLISLKSESLNRTVAKDALPDWLDIYSTARGAMKSFQDGGKGFETQVGRWTVAARPLLASDARCLVCHNSMTRGKVELQQPLGGVLYAFRRAPK